MQSCNHTKRLSATPASLEMIPRTTTEGRVMQTLSFARCGVVFAAIVTVAGCGAQGLPSRLGLPQRESTVQRPLSKSGYKLLYSFQGGKDGQDPEASLLYYNGKLYGTTVLGGNLKCLNGYGCGTVFGATTAGKESVVYGFAGGGKDGLWPHSSLIELKGQLYGTTIAGGNQLSGTQGTVYEVSTSGKERVLYSFAGSGDGAQPYSDLLAVGSTLYGTTFDGGNHSCYSSQCGTIFSVSTTGKEQVLYSFRGRPNDGEMPYAGLTEVNGALFGVTDEGGAIGAGGVFRSSLSGKEHLLYSFRRNDGWFAHTDLTLIKGKLYGTGVEGGAYGYGAVFEITPSGKEQLLYAFKGRPNDGSAPLGPLVEVGDNLYGVTSTGGAYKCFSNGEGCGTVFKLSMSGQETVLYTFKGGRDGALPAGGLVEANGLLYGTTFAGGSGKCPASSSGPAGCGTIFSIAP